MFQNHWLVVQKLQEIHQQDLMRAAYQAHLSKQTDNSNLPATPLLWRFFGWLGLQMVNLGSRIQQHYAQLARISVEMQANISRDEPCDC